MDNFWNKFKCRDSSEVERFLSLHPNFFEILENVFTEAYKWFEIIGKPILEATTDPECGGDFHLIAYFPVEDRGVKEVHRIMDFRKYIRSFLNDDERLLVTCFLTEKK